MKTSQFSMKITSRMWLVAGCAYLAAPLVTWLLHRPGGGISWLTLINSAIFATCAIAAFRRLRWTRWVLCVMALTSSVFALLVIVASPVGFYGFASLFQSDLVNDAGAAGLAARSTAVGLLINSLGAWVLFALAVKQPVVASDSREENRAVFAGLGVVMAWTVFVPFVRPLMQPLTQMTSTIALASREAARIELSVEQRRTLTPENVRMVDAINTDLGHLLSGQPVVHLQPPRTYGEALWYKSHTGEYELITYLDGDRIRQVNVLIYNDLNGELRRLPITTSFVLR
jgi:hypothetical protein